MEIKHFWQNFDTISIFSLPRTFPFTFFIADVADKILDLDFLIKFKIKVNFYNLYLTDNITRLRDNP